MPENGVGFAVPGKLAEPGSNDHRDCQRAQPADGVDHTRAREIHVALSEPEVGAKIRQPTASPSPVSEQRISESGE
jgi:hypothetical protein